MSEPQPFNPVLVNAHGAPLRPKAPAMCPSCGAGTDRRVKDQAFGPPQECCAKCGYEFKESPC